MDDCPRHQAFDTPNLSTCLPPTSCRAQLFRRNFRKGQRRAPPGSHRSHTQNTAGARTSERASHGMGQHTNARSNEDELLRTSLARLSYSLPVHLETLEDPVARGDGMGKPLRDSAGSFQELSCIPKNKTIKISESVMKHGPDNASLGHFHRVALAQIDRRAQHMHTCRILRHCCATYLCMRRIPPQMLPLSIDTDFPHCEDGCNLYRHGHLFIARPRGVNEPSRKTETHQYRRQPRG